MQSPDLPTEHLSRLIFPGSKLTVDLRSSDEEGGAGGADSKPLLDIGEAYVQAARPLATVWILDSTQEARPMDQLLVSLHEGPDDSLSDRGEADPPVAVLCLRPSDAEP